MATSAKKTLAHLTIAAAWDDGHVTAAYESTVTVDGETFTKPVEVNLTSPAVVKAARALETAVMKEIGADRPEKNSEREARLAAERAKNVQPSRAEDVHLLGTPSDVVTSKKSGARSKRASSRPAAKRR